MSLTTRGQDVFDISAYLEKYNLSWNSCVRICTDWAPCMIGSIKGFVSLVQRENPNVVQTHCFLHREVLVSKTIPDELNQVLKQVVEIVNFMKTRPFWSLVYLRKFVLIWTLSTNVWFCTLKRGGSQEERCCVVYMNCTRNYMHFSKQKNINASANIFNVNFGRDICTS